MEVHKIIKEYQSIYKDMVGNLIPSVFDSTISKHEVNAFIGKFEMISSFAWKFHPGVYADLYLEKRAADLGKVITENESKFLSSIGDEPKLGADSRRTVLHIASELYSTGGHTRFLLNIIKGDVNSRHCLVLTRYEIKNIPDWIVEAIDVSGGSVISLHAYDAVEKIYALKRIAGENVDNIFLHIHPDDIIPSIAFAQNKPAPIVFINHADHVFWIGVLISDIVACFRNWSIDFSLRRRFVNRAELVPIPLVFDANKIVSKAEARNRLGISQEEIVAITVASAYKFYPDQKYDYFNTVNKIIEKNPDISVKVIGPGVGDAVKIGYVASERIDLLGPIEDLTLYYIAADIYFDSMPLSSITSLLEAIYFGCFPVLQYSPANMLVHDNEPAIQAVLRHPSDEQELLANADRAIADEEYRQVISHRLAQNVAENYTGKGWVRLLENVYDITRQVSVPSDVSAAKVVSSSTIDENDLNSAMLSFVTAGEAGNYFMIFVEKYLSVLSIKDIVSLYRISLKHQKDAQFIKVSRYFIGMIKNKLSGNVASL